MKSSSMRTLGIIYKRLFVTTTNTDKYNQSHCSC